MTMKVTSLESCYDYESVTSLERQINILAAMTMKLTSLERQDLCDLKEKYFGCYDKKTCFQKGL